MGLAGAELRGNLSQRRATPQCSDGRHVFVAQFARARCRAVPDGIRVVSRPSVVAKVVTVVASLVAIAVADFQAWRTRADEGLCYELVDERPTLLSGTLQRDLLLAGIAVPPSPTL